MTSLKRFSYTVWPLLAWLAFFASGGSGTAWADSNHARIVRLSLVQGDVRFARDVKGDPLSDNRSGWEAAALNLPIRQGYVLATDAGRAEVEFENGALAFLAENTVLEFYDLSGDDDGFTTRLILRQGSAEFYVNPARGDYFSVTGGDFSVEAQSRTTFRINNFDDGSDVAVLRGRLSALVNGKSKLVEKNQSLALQAGDPDSMSVDRIPPSDDFDQWVSGRIDAAGTATTAASNYSSQYSYASGFGDLYTYGSWFPVAGYGNCWRPYGVGFGWSPFDYGSWYFDPSFGWIFLGGQQWGWLPYHYGGWLFRPGVGWVWSPSGTGGGALGRWRPVTGTWVKSGGAVGIVPSHPLDVKGKTPLNISQGVFGVTSRGVSGQVAVTDPSKWKVEGRPSRDLMQNQLAEATAPTRFSRVMAAGGGATATTRTGESGIVYDQAERRFVNANSPQSGERRAIEKAEPSAAQASGQAPAQGARVRVYPDPNRTSDPSGRVPPASARMNGKEGPSVPSARSAAPPRPQVAPPSVPRSVTTQRTFNEGARSGGSSGGSGGMGSGSASRSSGASSGSSASSGARSSGSSSGGGGGRPH